MTTRRRREARASRLAKDKGKIASASHVGRFVRGCRVSGGDPDDFRTRPRRVGDAGGAAREIRTLKELALLPLVYPEAFERLGVSPGRGVLLTARRARERPPRSRRCSARRRGDPAPCPSSVARGQTASGSTWARPAARSLRLLFQEAERRQPSIVFFDDAAAPRPRESAGGGARAAIHGSVVATLLALMDGLNPRGSVVVVAATNRPDAVDPALRRPGRFDRALRFALPGPAARRDILRLHTARVEPTTVRTRDTRRREAHGRRRGGGSARVGVGGDALGDS